MEFDVWFTRHDDVLFMALGEPGGPPTTKPMPIRSVKQAYDQFRKNGHTITQVGIADPELIGLF